MSHITINLSRPVNGVIVTFAAEADTKEGALKLATYLAGGDEPGEGAIAPVDQVKDKPAAEAKAGTKTAPAAETKVEAAAAVDYKTDVQPRLLEVNKAKGRDALIALLAKFGVTKGDQIPAADLPKVLVEVQELLAA